MSAKLPPRPKTAPDLSRRHSQPWTTQLQRPAPRPRTSSPPPPQPIAYPLPFYSSIPQYLSSTSHLPEQIAFLPSSPSSFSLSSPGTSPKFQFSNFMQDPTTTSTPIPSSPVLDGHYTAPIFDDPTATEPFTPTQPLSPSVALAIANFRPTPRQVISGIAPHVFDERPRRRRRPRAPRPYWYQGNGHQDISTHGYGYNSPNYSHHHPQQQQQYGQSDTYDNTFTKDGYSYGGTPGGGGGPWGSVKASSPLRMSAVISIDDYSIFVSDGTSVDQCDTSQSPSNATTKFGTEENREQTKEDKKDKSSSLTAPWTRSKKAKEKEKKKTKRLALRSTSMASIKSAGSSSSTSSGDANGSGKKSKWQGLKMMSLKTIVVKLRGPNASSKSKDH